MEAIVTVNATQRDAGAILNKCFAIALPMDHDSSSSATTIGSPNQQELSPQKSSAASILQSKTTITHESIENLENILEMLIGPQQLSDFVNEWTLLVLTGLSRASSRS